VAEALCAGAAVACCAAGDDESVKAAADSGFPVAERTCWPQAEPAKKRSIPRVRQRTKRNFMASPVWNVSALWKERFGHANRYANSYLLHASQDETRFVNLVAVSRWDR